jgi:hypothetical protein
MKHQTRRERQHEDALRVIAYAFISLSVVYITTAIVVCIKLAIT